QWREALEKKVFAGWPDDAGELHLKQIRQAAQAGFELAVYEFASQRDVPLRLHVLRPLGVEQPAETILNVCGPSGWNEWLAMAGAAFAEQLSDEAPVQPSDALASLKRLMTATRRQIAFFAPRGIGRSAWNPDPKQHAQIRRRFMLLGQTLEGMQAWDVRRAIQALRASPNQPGAPIMLVGSGPSAGIALYASLFEPPVAELQLSRLPRSHREGPNFLNILRYLDTPAAVAMAAERSRITLTEVSADDWEYPLAVARSLGWGSEQLEFESAD
ncbi:MAG TPA: hypothetical protein VHY20_08590, partial [Pirellulales bacterium]|nr:hypothetical protein [Pirellulales bacterium]